MAIVQTKTASIGQGSSSVAAVFDTGPTEGNLLLAIYSGAGLGGGTSTCSGFTNLDENWNSPQWHGHTVWAKEAGSSETSTVTVGLPANDAGSLLIVEWDGGEFDLTSLPSTLLDQAATNSAASGTSLAGASITTTDALTLSVFGGSYWQNSVEDKVDTFSWTANWVEYLEIGEEGGAGVNEFQAGASLRAITSTGTYNPTMTWTDASNGCYVFQVTLVMNRVTIEVAGSAAGVATVTGTAEASTADTADTVLPFFAQIVGGL